MAMPILPLKKYQVNLKRINSLLATVALISLTACGSTGSISTNTKPTFNTIENPVKISMPKYFYTNEINQTCKIEDDFYSSNTSKEFDLTDKQQYNWLKELEHYSWVKDHDMKGTSLDVHHEELTTRMGHVITAINNSILDGTYDEQAPLAIDLIMDWAKAEVIMDSTTVDEIKEMKKNGTFQACYKGVGDEDAVCHWHTAQEAQRFAGQVAILATLVRPHMNYKHLTHTENYLNAMFDKYILPWFMHSGSGNKEIESGFYQMGHGAISMVAYAHWKNNKKIANFAFDNTFRYIDGLVLEDGLIDNNSFRGVRGYWYHTLGLNNMLGMVALAEQYNYPVDENIYDKLTLASEFLNKDSEAHLEWLESLKKYKVSSGNLYTDYSGRSVYMGNVSWKHSNSRNHIHQESTFIDHLIEQYTKADLNKDSKEYKTFKRMTYSQHWDITLGFNPTCITR